jgi:hypothetical protein
MRNCPFTRCSVVLAASFALAASVSAFGQASSPNGGPAYSPKAGRTAPQASIPISAILDWTPPEITDLSTQASSKTSFAFDRSMLDAIAGFEGGGDPEFRQAWAKLEGVSIKVLRFGQGGIPSEEEVGAVRRAYHVAGLKHLVTSVGSGGPIHSHTTDVWLVLDGVNVKGAVILGETSKSVTLVTVKGDISAADLFHLRGHFGIPKFDQDGTGLGVPGTNGARTYSPGADGPKSLENN